METIEYRTFDKTTWGDGPWQSEPDKRQWTDQATGLPCLIARSMLGCLCGYVGISPGHPLHGVDYNGLAPLPRDKIVNVLRSQGTLELYEHEIGAKLRTGEILPAHGGITFSGDCQKGNAGEKICHAPALGEPDDVWWFGFDCGHADDLSPTMEAFLGRSFAELHGGSPIRRGRSVNYREIAYVEKECAELARMLEFIGR